MGKEDSCHQDILQHIIDLLPTRIFWKDLNLKYLGCNMAFAKDAGKKSPKEMIGKDDFQMVWKEQAKAYRKDDNAVIRSGKAKANFEEPQTTPDGRRIWLRTSKIPLTDGKKKIIGIIGMYDDITEIKNAEEELRENEAFLNEVGRIAKIGGWEMNVVTGKAKWTKATYDIVGIPYDAPVPGFAEYVSLCHPEDQEMVGQEMGELARSGKPLDIQTRIATDSGEKWLHVLGTCVKEGKKCVKVKGTIQDITAQKKALARTDERTAEIERFNKMAIGREVKMAELKKRVRELERMLGQ
jgi:PAS domain S-box-containing protein